MKHSTKTLQFEELKSLDLQMCHSVGDIVDAMRYCAFGARMLGEVAHTIFEMVTAKDKPILIYSGIADAPLGLLLKKFVSNRWCRRIMLPSQYFSVLRKTAPQGPEYLLVIAMLQDAIECFQKYRWAIDENGQQLYADANEWIESEDRKWPFSFENVCGVLNLNPDYIRVGLNRWVERAEVRRRANKVVPIKPAVAPLPEAVPVPVPVAARAS